VPRDVGFVTPQDTEQAAAIVAEIRAEQEAAGRADQTVHVFGDLVVFLDETTSAAQARRSRLDALLDAPYTSDARIFTGTPAELADLLLEFQRAGLTGFRLRPADADHDLRAISRGLVPELRSRGAFRSSYEAATLRGPARAAAARQPLRHHQRLSRRDHHRHECLRDSQAQADPPRGPTSPASTTPPCGATRRPAAISSSSSFAHFARNRRARQVRLPVPRRGPAAA